VAADSTGGMSPRQHLRDTIPVMLRPLQRLSREQGHRLAAAAAEHPLAQPGVAYERWYLRRWHCLPEGYLSRRCARAYERLVVPLYSFGGEARVARFVAAACAGAGDILDAGCGPGRLLAALRVRRPDARLYGADLSPYSVEVAATRLGHAPGVPEVRHADARYLPWPDCTFDAVVAAHVLGHVPGEVAHGILREAARVLRPGGSLVTVEHAWHRAMMPGFCERSRQRAAHGLVLVRRYALATRSVANGRDHWREHSQAPGTGRARRPVE
jgi:ubiquinone/menaquinone biosynthesis C-methylase UbiE